MGTFSAGVLCFLGSWFLFRDFLNPAQKRQAAVGWVFVALGILAYLFV